MKCWPRRKSSMSRRDPMLRMRHMLDHAREVLALVEGRTRADLHADRALNLQVVRLLEIIGEAAGGVPQDESLKHPGIPWARIVGLRNRLVHEYDAVDFDIVWKIVTEDVSLLVRELESILPPGNGSP